MESFFVCVWKWNLLDPVSTRPRHLYGFAMDCPIENIPWFCLQLFLQEVDLLSLAAEVDFFGGMDHKTTGSAWARAMAIPPWLVRVQYQFGWPNKSPINIQIQHASNFNKKMVVVKLTYLDVSCPNSQLRLLQTTIETTLLCAWAARSGTGGGTMLAWEINGHPRMWKCKHQELRKNLFKQSNIYYWTFNNMYLFIYYLLYIKCPPRCPGIRHHWLGSSPSSLRDQACG